MRLRQLFGSIAKHKAQKFNPDSDLIFCGIRGVLRFWAGLPFCRRPGAYFFVTEFFQHFLSCFRLNVIGPKAKAMFECFPFQWA